MDDINEIFMKRPDKLTLAEATDILLRAEKGDYDNNISTNIPVKPKGGDVLLYRKKTVSDIDYRCDQYVWRCNGRSRHHKCVFQTYYKIAGRDSRTPLDGFSKSVFQLKKPKSVTNPIVLIQYIGNEELFVSRPHGNTKKVRAYVRTQPSCLQKMRKDVQRQESAPKQIYQENLYTSRKSFEGEHYDDFEPVIAPRDIKQIKNLRQNEASHRMLLRDELFSILEMAQGDLKGFVHKYTYTPDGSIIVLGAPESIDMGKQILRDCNDKPEILRQLLTYDTTFECGDIYLSPLIMRNTYLEGDPIFPVMFLLHDRKKQWQHEDFFHIAVRELQLEKYATAIPIATDREKSIVNAINVAFSTANHVYCQNHIIRDVEQWILHQKGYTTDDVVALKHNIRQLIECESEEEFDVMCDQLSKKWTTSFHDYFIKNIRTDLREKSAGYRVKKFSAFKDVCATNNQSESFNSVIKQSINRKELRLDALVLVLYQIQMHYLSEFNRAINGLGQYHVKSAYGGIKRLQLGPLAHLSVADLILRLSGDVHSAPCATEHLPGYRTTAKTLAQLIIDNDLLSVDCKSKSYVVRSPYKNDRYVIWLAKDKYVCSCRSTGLCSHVISVLLFNDIEIPTGTEDSCSYKLSVLLKRSRGREGKSGRKRPRAKDIDITIKPADDSEAVQGASKHNVHRTKKAMPAASTPKHKTKHVTQTSLSSTQVSSGAPCDDFALRERADREFEERYGSVVIQTFDVPQDFVLQREDLQDERFQSLGARRDISGFAIDDIINIAVNDMEVGRSVLFVDTMTHRDLGNNRYSEVINFLGQHEALNKDYILVMMNTDVIGKGSHWILGMVAFNEKWLITFDSLVYITEDVRLPQFRQLATLASISCCIAKVDFNIDDWSCIFSRDCPKQYNSYDCGLHATSTAVCIVAGFQYVHLESGSGRRWMQFHLRKRRGQHPVRRFEPGIDFSVTAQLLSLCEEQAATINNHELFVEATNTEDKTLSVAVEKQGWTICGASHSCGLDISHAEAHLLCVSCRRWFHEMCVGTSGAEQIYYICSDCNT